MRRFMVLWGLSGEVTLDQGMRLFSKCHVMSDLVHLVGSSCNNLQVVKQ